MALALTISLVQERRKVWGVTEGVGGDGEVDAGGFGVAVDGVAQGVAG